MSPAPVSHSGPGDPPDAVTTLGAAGQAEIRIQRSRFVGLAQPAADAEAARDAVAAVARQHHDARHACYGWRLGLPPAVVENRNDDGEPSGTAGEPILAAIRKCGLVDTVVVVVRWFGGVKLGTGGLARAYGEAAALALEAAPRRTVALGREFDLRFAYAFQKTAHRLVDQHAGEVRSEDYGVDVAWRVWLPHSRWSACAAAFVEVSAGQVTLIPAD